MFLLDNLSLLKNGTGCMNQKILMIADQFIEANNLQSPLTGIRLDKVIAMRKQRQCLYDD